LDKIERREDRKGDAAHATNERFVSKKYACNDKTKKIGWQNGFAFSCRGKAAEKEQDKEDKFYFRFAHLRCTQARDDRLRPPWHEPQNDQRHDHKQQQPEIVVGEQGAERQYGSEIGDEACSQDHLAHGSVTKSALDHHG